MEIIEIDRDPPESDETIGGWVLKIIRQQAFMLALDDYTITSLTMSDQIYEMYHGIETHFYFDIKTNPDMKYSDKLKTEYMFDFIIRIRKRNQSYEDLHYIVNRDIIGERDGYINNVLNS